MQFVRCPSCRVLRIEPENLVHSTVLPDPVGKLSVAMKILLAMRIRWLTQELPQIADKDIRIADIGCGDGQFIEFLRARGYRNVIGIEPDEKRASHARLRNVPVFSSRREAEAAGRLQKTVEVLFVWHVLEHIDRPAEFIEEYAHWLTSSGVMIISVPNQASLQTRLFGYYSAYPDYGRHIWYHTADYREWLAQNAPGFEIAILRNSNYEYEIFSWVESVASTTTRQQNFIHRTLKKGEGGPARRLAAAFTAAGLLPLAFLLSPLSGRSQSASTLTFILRRSDHEQQTGTR
jgi:2-polyprenyl-3-methyl-5-hydroxy-6-metoxy-1,4-benzoquinol methylase